MEGAVRVRRVQIRGGQGRGRGGEEVRGLEEVRGRGQGGARSGRGGDRGRVRRVRNRITDDIRATIVDDVINHGMTLREAGQRVQPNLSRYTVASIIRTFRNENRIARRPDVGGRGRMFTPEQETHIVNMVISNNAIRLREIQQRIIDNDTIFQNIHSVSISALSLQSSFREKHKTCKATRVMELEADAMGHELLFVDDAGFNLSKTRRHGRNITGHRTINVPGQRGGPYNTAHIIAFLDPLHDMLTGALDWRIPHAMWMKFCGRTRKDDMM
ncbi:uncharacterized protein LOC113071049 [Carassius auratus]|uniref:Uncharacterized protein LOC113071049 n=1 Tax=Carassius auratus TaxID=7957 RepID=A0A6P6MV21_CARAU|nr:uncharacterized protein LOC113071049 [Carassius auratus]